MTDYVELLDLIKKNVTLFQELTQIQQVKLEGAKNYDITMLEDCMKKEQAHTLALRGLDKKRIGLQKKLSFEDKTFRQLIPLVPEEYQVSYQEAFQELNDSYQGYQEVSACAKEMLEVTIYKTSAMINHIRELANLPSPDVYTPDGKVSHQLQNRKDMKI